MVAYVNILWTLIWTFIFFSLLLIPTMNNYRAGVAYEDDHLTGYATGMISNLGYSTMECRNIPLSLGNIAIDCPYGVVGGIIDYGVNNPDEGSPIDACQTNSINRKCKPSTAMLDAFKKAIGKDHLNVGFSASAGSCNSANAQLYVQYSCI